ncbi:Uncharacterised protein [Sebaldella termitidis]|uniref:Uncharacterized protein n=1 Tax=Sebaldella termitidis (strain ATCC 33386 / NCTC 11300) TaxID=526218 RepID=D1AGM9_SEBTE|nr:hypothetical protein [Sebaldella termitidis]ACZ10749.1 hypothetical protein Sterm_3916 [Sebaldella termitidis ATCC 33386]SUI26092.1 Uncharacterised protein [Sebaldella termitidis]
MDNKKIESLLNITYEILLDQNKNIEKSEKKLSELEETLSGNDENFFILRGLSGSMVSALQETKKDYFLNHINDFIGVNNLSLEIKEYALKKISGNCDDETESIRGNLKYNESSTESKKLEKEMKEKFSGEENTVFEIYLELLVDIQSEENLLFYEAMLQTGAYLNKIEEITEV